MTVIQFASRARANAPAAPQVTTATVFQFPARPRDCFDAADYLTPSERDLCRARSRRRHARRDAMKRFGNRLRAVRTILGLSIEAAADATGINLQSFKNYESGATEMRTARFMAFVNHPTVALRGFLLTWLLEDGVPADKERLMVKHCRSTGVQISHEAAGAINALDAAARMVRWGDQ